MHLPARLTAASCVHSSKFATKNRVDLQVLEYIALANMLAQTPLVPHAQLLHHSPRCRVACEVRSMDARQAQRVEAVVQHSEPCLGAVAVSPETQTNPV